MRKRVKVVFQDCLILRQEIGVDGNDTTEARISFLVHVPSKPLFEAYVNVKQVAGSTAEELPLEVGRPVGYDGPFNHQIFRDEVEAIYKKEIGAWGRAVGIQGGKNIVILESVIGLKGEIEIEVEDDKGRAW